MFATSFPRLDVDRFKETDKHGKATTRFHRQWLLEFVAAHSTDFGGDLGGHDAKVSRASDLSQELGVRISSTRSMK
jgi:hypothetical protein